MTGLEEWIIRCIAIPVNEFPCGSALRYDAEPYDEKDFEVETESGYLPFDQLLQEMELGETDEEHQVNEPILRQLHAYARNQPFEDYLWDSVIWPLDHTLPDDISHDLIDRRIAIYALGHRRQNRAVARRLAHLDGTALKQLFCEMYEDYSTSTEEFTQLFEEYGLHDWIFRFLGSCIPSSLHKEAALLQLLEGRPEWQMVRDRQLERERIQKEKDELDHAIERAKFTTAPEEIQSLFEGSQVEVLIALTRNPLTPLEILVSMSQARNFEGAIQLRIDSKNAIDRRERKVRNMILDS